MAGTNSGTNVGNYLIEIDGVAVCRASEIDTGGSKHEPFQIHVGDSELAIWGRGKASIQPVKVKHAIGINNAAAEMSQIFQDYRKGLNVSKLNIRVVTMGEDGFGVIATDDYIDCVPLDFVPESKKGEGKEAAYFTMSFQPSDHEPSY